MENPKSKKKRKAKILTLVRKKRGNESWFKYIMSVSHLWLGLLSSVIVFIVCLSGSIYAYKQQVVNLVNRDLLTVTPSMAATLPVDTLLNRFEAQYGKATTIYLYPQKDRSVLISSSAKNKPGISVYYDPYTGKSVGIKNDTPETVFAFILKLHRFLLMDEVGKQINGVAVLIFTYLLLSGFVLWLPKKWKQLKNALAVKWNARFYRLNYDLHNVLGFYSLLLLFFIATTGLYFSLHWVKNAIIVGLGGESIAISADNKQVKNDLAQSFSQLLGTLEKENKTAVPEQNTSVQALINTADSVFQYPGIQRITLPNEEVHSFQYTRMNAQHFTGFTVPDKIEFSAQGAIRTASPFRDLRLHEQFKAIAKPLHTGEILGIAGIILYSIISLIGCSLPVTGFIIWWKKKA